MFQQLEESSGRIVGYRVSGKLTDEDYEILVPQLEKVIERWVTIRLLLEFDDFHGWDIEAAWDDFKFGMKHNNDIERLALVGDRKWEEWMAKLAKPFMNAEVRYYDRSELDSAWYWLREASKT
jgi:SpoIIAA-like